MYLWPLIIIALILQESASAAAVFVVALQNHLSLWPIHLIWIGATLLDVIVGFEVGKFMRKRFEKARVIGFLERWLGKMKKMLGGHGEKLSLALLAIVNFPYLNAFLGAWLGIPRNIVILTTLVGNLIWYLLVWGAVLGLAALISNSEIILFVIIAVGVIANVIFRPFGHTKGAS